MSLFALLLKKELKGFKNYKRNIAGSVIGAVAVLAVMAVFVYLFIELNGKFIPLGISNEILSLFIAAIMIFSVILSLNKAAVIMFTAEDADILRPLPLNPRVVVLSKVAALLIYELASVGAFSLPIFIAFGIINGFGAGFYFKALFTIIIMAVTVAAVSGIIAPAFNAAKQFLLKHGPLFLILSLIFIGLLFFAYKYVLDFLIMLIRSRKLQFIFNSTVVKGIRAVAGGLLFSSSLGMFLNGANYWRVFICFALAAGLIAGCYFICAALYGNLKKSRAAEAKARPGKRRSVKGALLFKEINELVRTPGYMFSYLSIVLSLPALTYLTMGVLKEVVSQLLTASFVAPFALMIVVLYSTVSNTFAGDAVSREGSKLSIIKTIPVTYKVQVGIKLALALGIACFALIITAVLLVASGFVGLMDGLMIFLVALLSTVATIVSMVNNDLKGVNSEKNAAVSVVKSLLYAVLAGVFATVMAFASGGLTIYLIPAAVSVLYCAMAVAGYVKNLDKRMKAL